MARETSGRGSGMRGSRRSRRAASAAGRDTRYQVVRGGWPRKSATGNQARGSPSSTPIQGAAYRVSPVPDRQQTVRFDRPGHSKIRSGACLKLIVVAALLAAIGLVVFVALTQADNAARREHGSGRGEGHFMQALDDNGEVVNIMLNSPVRQPGWKLAINAPEGHNVTSSPTPAPIARVRPTLKRFYWMRDGGGEMQLSGPTTSPPLESHGYRNEQGAGQSTTTTQRHWKPKPTTTTLTSTTTTTSTATKLMAREFVPDECRRIIPQAGRAMRCTNRMIVGSTCHFSCTSLSSYLEGISRIRCKASRRWSHPPPVCKTSCNPISRVGASDISCTMLEVEESVCTITCDSVAGYFDADGTTSPVALTCQSSGTWSRGGVAWSVPCWKKCPELPSIAHGDVKCTNANYGGSTCTPRCKRGYNMSSSAKISCMGNGVWSGPVHTCT